MTDPTTSTALSYYARHNCALFPIPAGSKSPVGIVASFAHDHSRSPDQWATWRNAHPNCNFGVVAGPSRLIIADVDVSELGRDRAWALWHEWWTSRGLPVPLPHLESARGGWHFYFRSPDSDTPLRQVALIGPTDGSKKAVVDLRVGNGFTVAGGSFYDGAARGEQSGHYTFLTDSPPHPAPAALIEHCTRRVTKHAGAANVGTRDKGDVAALITWLHEREQFNDYDSWVSLGMACKVEFGDAGFELWELATWPDALDAAGDKWESFATDATADSVTINTFIDRAHRAGWRGSIRKATSAMFDGVAALAAAAGATLPGAEPMPMVAGQQELTRIGTPVLEQFLAGTDDLPTRPRDPDAPALPDAVSGHGLYAPLSQAISRILAAAETPKTFKATRFIDPLALLSLVHQDTFDCVCRRIRTLGCTLPDSRIKTTATAYADRVERAFVKQDDWIYDAKGQIENTNSDNVAVLLNILNISIRWNAWLERMEIQGGVDEDLRFPDWTYVDDLIIARLRTRANRTKTRFVPAKDFFWESLTSLALANKVDPVLERLAELEAAWDGTPRLSTWLARACHTECDPYHQAVARNILGGLVRRAREPGSKHDTMAVFHGPQGPGKSTMAAVIADLGVSSLAEITRRSSPWFTDTVLLGAESKELVLALAGKTVVEIGEMGMRGSVNANMVKAMVSRQVDEGRTAYARAVTSRPRRNIFIGTVNGDEPLTDPTGNRRFLPVSVQSPIDLEWLSDNIGQIIGEAAALHSKGAAFDLPASVWAVAAEHQEAARSESDIEVKFADWFGETPTTAYAYVTAADLVDACKLSNLTGNQHGVFMKKLGFRSMTAYVSGRRARAWYRGPAGNMRKDAVRYCIGRTADSRVRVEIRAPNG